MKEFFIRIGIVLLFFYTTKIIVYLNHIIFNLQFEKQLIDACLIITISVCVYILREKRNTND